MSENTVPRIDPKSRPVDGDVGCRVLNPRADRFYVLANPNDAETGLQYYLDRGFDVVRDKDKDGVRLEGGRGSPELDGALTRHGQVLVCCPKAEQDARNEAKEAWATKVDQSLRPGSRQLDKDFSVHTKTTLTTG